MEIETTSKGEAISSRCRHHSLHCRAQQVWAPSNEVVCLYCTTQKAPEALEPPKPSVRRRLDTYHNIYIFSLCT